MGKAAALVPEIYDLLGLEGSIIRQPCENRWTDRHPGTDSLTWIFSPLLTNGIHMPGEIFISAGFQATGCDAVVAKKPPIPLPLSQGAEI